MRRSRRSSAVLWYLPFLPRDQGDQRGVGGAGRGGGTGRTVGHGRLLNLRWLPSIRRTTWRDVREVSDGPRSQRGCARTDRRRQLGRPVGRAVPALARSRGAGGGAAGGYRYKRPGRPLPPAYGGDPALGRAGGRRPAQVAGAVSAGRRDQQR